MISIISQWTILQRLEYETIVVELRELEAPVNAGDAPAWERSKELLARAQELVKLAHKRAARPVAEASAR